MAAPRILFNLLDLSGLVSCYCPDNPALSAFAYPRPQNAISPIAQPRVPHAFFPQLIVLSLDYFIPSRRFGTGGMEGDCGRYPRERFRTSIFFKFFFWTTLANYFRKIVAPISSEQVQS